MYIRSVFALIQALSERDAFGGVRGVFYLLSYIGLALDKRMVQNSNLYIWRVIWGHQMSAVVNLCVYLYVCKSIRES